MDRLQVAGLCVTRGDREVLAHLAFSVGAGEALHLIGRNGVGKTSLLEVLCGLRAPAGGTIRGQPQADELYWVGHRNGVHAALSPFENLRFWCRLAAMPTAGVGDALRRVGLWGLRHRACGRLSTGQRRRAALARLLVVPRPWWFLDEPLAGLDVAGIALTCDLVAEHVKRGGAVVLSSHQALPRTLPGLRELVLAA
ncbi:MAG TPA: heme ABC exporter ATP-binding protein CcmA [Rhodanobacteraceae bacterium]|nr:heme ABC exporter ATP-binding protein CcmA [Rhodanobacteraceae bacterium]